MVYVIEIPCLIFRLAYLKALPYLLFNLHKFSVFLQLQSMFLSNDLAHLAFHLFNSIFLFCFRC